MNKKRIIPRAEVTLNSASIGTSRDPLIIREGSHQCHSGSSLPPFLHQFPLCLRFHHEMQEINQQDTYGKCHEQEYKETTKECQEFSRTI